jgi:hypothetical protein
MTKYIRHKDLGIITFDGSRLQHAQLAEWLGGRDQILSAGLVLQTHDPDKPFKCTGDTTLRISADSGDTDRLNAQFTSFH